MLPLEPRGLHGPTDLQATQSWDLSPLSKLGDGRQPGGRAEKGLMGWGGESRVGKEREARQGHWVEQKAGVSRPPNRQDALPLGLQGPPSHLSKDLWARASNFFPAFSLPFSNSLAESWLVWLSGLSTGL